MSRVILFHMRISERLARQNLQVSLKGVAQKTEAENQKNFSTIEVIVLFKPAFKRKLSRS